VSDGGEDQGAEEAFMGQKKKAKNRHIPSVLERARLAHERLFLSLKGHPNRLTFRAIGFDALSDDKRFIHQHRLAYCAKG